MFLGIDFINKYAYHLLHNNIDSITMIFDNDNVIEFGIDIIILWMFFVSFFFIQNPSAYTIILKKF